VKSILALSSRLEANTRATPKRSRFPCSLGFSRSFLQSVNSSRVHDRFREIKNKGESRPDLALTYEFLSRTLRARVERCRRFHGEESRLR
jgi:hypothetical protein